MEKNVKVYYVTRQDLAKALKDVVFGECSELHSATLEVNENAKVKLRQNVEKTASRIERG